MKNPVLLCTLFVFSLFATSCKKDEKKESSKPSPSVLIEFGHSYQSYHSRNFPDQNQVPLDSFRNSVALYITVTESNVASLNGFTTDSGIIRFNAYTDKDEELFQEENVGDRMFFSSNFGSSIEFGAAYGIPFKITDQAVKGNDTLEISGSGDRLRIGYQSVYTGLQGADSIDMIP